RVRNGTYCSKTSGLFVESLEGTAHATGFHAMPPSVAPLNLETCEWLPPIGKGEHHGIDCSRQSSCLPKAPHDTQLRPDHFQVPEDMVLVSSMFGVRPRLDGSQRGTHNALTHFRVPAASSFIMHYCRFKKRHYCPTNLKSFNCTWQRPRAV